MAKRSAKCPQCGNRVEIDSEADGKIVCPQCQAHLTVNVHKTGEQDHTKKPAAPADPLIGQTLGEFEIVDLLGRGGMGAVYKARQPSLGRMVAVKVLSKDHSRDRAYVGRFDREARAAAAVNHTNIIQIYSVGADRGYQYIAMEIVEGETLADVLRRDGPLPPDRAIEIMKQAAAALAEAHAAGIVHRDIKPSNILLTPRGGVKVADFGLAKRPDADVAITQAGKVLGTPLYMPPEVLGGQEFEPRSDLYSLGATFYHVLAGRPPFEGRTSSEIAVKQVREEVPPLARIAPQVPRPLARVIHRLLAKTPGGRYPTAAALLETLEYIDADMAATTPPSGSGPAIPAAKRRILNKIPTAKKAQVPKALIAGVAAGVVALAVILMVVLLPKDEPAPQKPASDPKPPGPVVITPKPKPPTPKPKPPTPKPKPPTPKPKPPKPVSEWTTLPNGWRVGKAVNLGPPVNSPAHDGCPSVSADGRTMVFTSARGGGQGKDDMWMSSRPIADAPWGQPVNLGAPVNTQGDERSPSLSADGLTLVFDSDRTGGQGGADLWVCTRRGTTQPWGPPVNLGPPVNSHNGECQPCLSTDGLTLIFMLHGDLWMSSRPSADAPWGKPAKLGAPVNTKDGERSSFLSADGLALVFTTDRAGGQGREDLWMSTRAASTKPFGEPVNLGPSVNSATRDGEPCLSADRRTLYFHSIRPGGHGYSDIWQAPLLPPGAPLPTAPPDDDARWTAWEDLFDGKTLKGWRVVNGEAFEEHGDVQVKQEAIVLSRGKELTGIVPDRPMPRSSYEIAYEARAIGREGEFGSLIFPCLGELVRWGIQSKTTGAKQFTRSAPELGTGPRPVILPVETWHRCRLRVEPDRIRAWIGAEQVIDVDLVRNPPQTNKHWSKHGAEAASDFIFFAKGCDAGLRNIRLRRPKAVPRGSPATKPTAGKAGPLEARYAKALRPAEAMAAAWDFAGADAALAKLDFKEKELAQRLATRRDEVARLARLKAKIVAEVNKAKPWLRKGQAVVPGSGGKKFKAVGEQIASADEKGVTLRDVKAVGEKSRRQPWAELDKRVLPKLLALAVSADNADDQLAAGLLALVRKDAATAEKHFERARTLGVKIDRYLGPLAAAAFANAKAMLDAKKYTEADKALAALAKKYAKTPWFASHKDELAAVRARVKSATAEAEAEKLYAQAAEFHKKKELWDLKVRVDKLKRDYPKTAAVTDTKRRPSFAEYVKAVAALGRFLTVRQDGNGDFRTIQAAIDAAPINSLIEIQDGGRYNEGIMVPKAKEGITLRGSQGVWPIIASPPAGGGVPKDLLRVLARRVTVERLHLLHVRPQGARAACVAIEAGAFRVCRAIVYAEQGGHALSFVTRAGCDAVFENCVFAQYVLLDGPVDLRSCIWVAGDFNSWGARAPVKLENVVIPRIPAGASFEARFCTIPGDVHLKLGSGVVRDSIVGAIHAEKAGARIEHCNLFDKEPLRGLAKPGKNCFKTNPRFRNPDLLDYRLKPNSPCRGKASDGGDVGCRYSPEMIELLKLAFELRKKGIIKF